MDLIQTIQDTFDVNLIYAQRIAGMVNGDNAIDEARKIIAEKPKPFVKWVGGKRQLLKQFRKLGLYPPSGFNPITATYFEPFVGGGAVFFDLLPQKAIISDLNRELVITYNVIKNYIDQLIDSLNKHIYDKEYFLYVRSKDISNLSDIDIASRFIYLNRTCFNGMYRVNKKGKFNVPFGKYSNPQICDEQNLHRVSDSLDNVEIKCQDYKEVLQNAVGGDFIYFDPPYYPINNTSSFTSYTSKVFLDKEQIELRNTYYELNNRGCFVMLSNSDTPFINRIYKEIENENIKITKVSAGRSINSKASGRGKITEVLIINY